MTLHEPPAMELPQTTAEKQPVSPAPQPQKKPTAVPPTLREQARKVAPLLGVQGALVLLELGAVDYGSPVLAMAYGFAVLDLGIMNQKERFFGSSGFRRGCVMISIIVSVVATVLAPYIPWGWLLHLRPTGS